MINKNFKIKCNEANYDEAEIREEYKKLTGRLIEERLTITTMESATSGQIASLITDTEGSSAVLKGAFITYSNEAKILIGVPEKIINRFSVYSKETAAAMAERCRDIYKADIGIGVTGTMGNADPLNPESSEPGVLYFAICFKGETRAYMVEIPYQESRLQYKLAAAKEVLEALNKILG